MNGAIQSITEEHARAISNRSRQERQIIQRFQTPHFHNQSDLRNNKKKINEIKQIMRKQKKNLWSDRKRKNRIRRGDQTTDRRRRRDFWIRMRRKEPGPTAMREKTTSSPLLSASSINGDFFTNRVFRALSQHGRKKGKCKWKGKRKKKTTKFHIDQCKRRRITKFKDFTPQRSDYPTRLRLDGPDYWSIIF